MCFSKGVKTFLTPKLRKIITKFHKSRYFGNKISQVSKLQNFTTYHMRLSLETNKQY
jgi:hypothetical protein